MVLTDGGALTGAAGGLQLSSIEKRREKGRGEAVMGKIVFLPST
jgi:hypothetical protein